MSDIAANITFEKYEAQTLHWLVAIIHISKSRGDGISELVPTDIQFHLMGYAILHKSHQEHLVKYLGQTQNSKLCNRGWKVKTDLRWSDSVE